MFAILAALCCLLALVTDDRLLTYWQWLFLTLLLFALDRLVDWVPWGERRRGNVG